MQTATMLVLYSTYSTCVCAVGRFVVRRLSLRARDESILEFFSAFPGHPVSSKYL
jgi:hypothetical protein